MRKLGKHWNVFNHKGLAVSFVKCLPKFSMRESRIWKFTKNGTTFGVSNTYAGTFQELSWKGDTRPLRRKPLLCRQQSHVSSAKQEDVKCLLNFITLTDEEKLFYDVALCQSKVTKEKKSLSKPVVVSK